jgi:cytochrome c-type biogenesis protein CcmF
VAYALGVEQIAALLTFAICAFAGASILAVWGRDLAARFRQARTREPKTDMTMGGINRHRYGAHLVHLGIVLIAVGVVGSSFYQKEIQIALDPGETVGLQGYTLTYQEYTAQELPDQHQFTALVSISRGSKTPTTLRPQKVFHWTAEQWVTEVAIHSTLARDLYLILAGLESDGLATLIVLINPLVAWLWIGAILLLAGGVIAWWPGPVAKHAKMG